MLFFLITLFHTIITSAQTDIKEENMSIEIVKTRKIKALSVSWQGNHGNIVSGKGQKKIQLRLRVVSLDDKNTPFDPNKLYFVNDAYEARFALADVSYARFMRTRIFQRLKDKESERSAYSAKYDPNIPNTFLDYPYKKYKDVPLSLNFGTKRRPNIHTLYFKPNKIKDHPLDLYFIIPKDIKEGRIYYGDTFIKDINFK